VNYLHRKRIVHRDLKPANILLLNSTTLKITDFNSAKRVGASQGRSQMLTDRGDHIYSAPELRFGRLWNERVDIWACGHCFYHMRCGCLPFNITHTDDAELLRAGTLPELNLCYFSPSAENLLLQMLTVDAHNRPPAMQLLLHPMFNEILKQPPSSAQKVRPFCGYNRGNFSSEPDAVSTKSPTSARTMSSTFREGGVCPGVSTSRSVADEP